MPVAAATRPCGRSASSKPSSAATGTMTWSLPPSTVTGTRTAVRSPLCVSARPETASMSCSTVKTRHLSASTGPSCGADRDSLTPIRSGKKTRRSPAASLTSCPMRNTVPWSAGATLVAMWLFSRPSPPAWIRRWSHATTCPIRSSAPSRSAPSRTSRWMSGLR